MHILIETIDDALDLRRLLGEHGWQLVEVGPSRYHASHPGVNTPASARVRLDRLGLLTSKQLSFDFCPTT
jgi:hypothetical protein